MDKRVYILVSKEIDQNGNIVKEVQTTVDGTGANLDFMIETFQEFLAGCGFLFDKKAIQLIDIFEE